MLVRARSRVDVSGQGISSQMSNSCAFGLAEWLPDNSDARVQLRNVRYYYQTELPEKQSFVSAVALNGVYGTGRTISAPYLN